jgi:hypothetical protein
MRPATVYQFEEVLTELLVLVHSTDIIHFKGSTQDQIWQLRYSVFGSAQTSCCWTCHEAISKGDKAKL